MARPVPSLGAWTIEYLCVPREEADRAKTRRWMDDAFEQSFRGFDRDRYPTWRDWLAGASNYPNRVAVIERLRAVGILDQRGAQLGW